MNVSVCEETETERKWLRWALRGFIGVAVYLLSTGPILRIIDAGWLPDMAGYIYLPLFPFLKIQAVHDLFLWYTASVWHAYPYGYTTI